MLLPVRNLFGLFLPFLVVSTTAQTILERVVASPDHNTLEAAVLAAPETIAAALGNANSQLTLFAPDDAAFTSLVAAVGQAYVNDLLTPKYAPHLVCFLTSHVIASVVRSTDITGRAMVPTLSGYQVTVDVNPVSVDNNPVTSADIAATNGVVHVISRLPILPPCVSQSIFDIGSGDANFSTLISLVESAGLKDALSTTRPLTLFAPTDAAFAKVPQSTLNMLSTNADALRQVLLYHVVGDILVVGRSTLDSQFTTLQGEAVKLEAKFGVMVEVNELRVATKDILASNGVIHVINDVLLPSAFQQEHFQQDIFQQDNSQQDNSQQEHFRQDNFQQENVFVRRRKRGRNGSKKKWRGKKGKKGRVRT